MTVGPERRDDVYVYWARPTSGRDLAHLLDDVERATLDTLHLPRDRDRYVSAHVLLRRALAEHTGVPEEEQRFHRRCVLCGGPHGKPRLVPRDVDPRDLTAVAALTTPHVNLSYSGNRILLALRPTGAVGVDVETWDMTDFAGFPSVALTPVEARELLEFAPEDRVAARTAWWCRKEAVLKATGHGLRVDAVRLRVSAPDSAPTLLDWTDPDVPRPVVTMEDLPVPGRYEAALAVSGQVRLNVEMSELTDLHVPARRRVA